MAKSDLQLLCELHDRLQLEDAPLHESPDYNPKRTHKVFVYGTLKRGFRNNGRLEKSKLLGTYVTRDGYELLSKRINRDMLAPALLPDGPYRVRGELYEVSGRILKVLDLYEGHPMVYLRDTIHLEQYEKPVNAYLYGLDHNVKGLNDGIRVNAGIAEFIQDRNHG